MHSKATLIGDNSLVELVFSISIISLVLGFCVEKVDNFADLARLTEPVAYFQNLRIEWGVDNAFSGKENLRSLENIDSFKRSVVAIDMENSKTIVMRLSDNFAVYQNQSLVWSIEQDWPHFAVNHGHCQLKTATDVRLPVGASRAVANILCP